MERYAICCETPFQLLNAFNYAVNHSHENVELDLYIRKDFWLGSDLIARIEEVNIFDRVFVFEYRNNDLYTGKKLNIEKLQRTFFPVRYINSRILNGKAYLKYDLIFVAYLQPFEYGLLIANDSAKLIYYDDGMASYMNNYPLEGFGRSRKILKLLGKNDNFYRPEKLYINNLQFCNDPITENVEEFFPLSKADAEFWKKIDYVFQYSQSGFYEKNKTIFLSMPNDLESEIFAEHVDTILSLLCGERNCAVRPHPRDTRKFDDSVNVDRNNDLWELVSLRELQNDNCLISIFSTAQFTPKMIYDKEPYLIFLYKLFGDVFKMTDKMSGMIDVIRSHYSDPSKIIVVNDTDELVKALDLVSDRRSI